MSLGKEGDHYLRRVLRKRPGDQFAALDGEGRSWLCSLEDSGARRVDDFPAVPQLSPRLTVGLALCKGSRFESALEKLAELGVARVVPLSTERTERKSPSSAKLARWREIGLSASAVARRLIPLRVEEPCTLTGFLESERGELCFCHPGGIAPSGYFSVERAELALLIGPEGGFSPEEVSLLEGKATKVALGPLNLRVETAALLAAGMALRLARHP